MDSTFYLTLWNDLLTTLQNDPPKIKLNAFKKISSFNTDPNVFKGRELLSWLKTFLENEKKKIKDMRDPTPEHIYNLASALLKEGIIEPENISKNTTDRVNFSLRKRYVIKDNVIVMNYQSDTNNNGNNTDSNSTDTDNQVSSASLDRTKSFHRISQKNSVLSVDNSIVKRTPTSVSEGYEGKRSFSQTDKTCAILSFLKDKECKTKCDTICSLKTRLEQSEQQQQQQQQQQDDEEVGCHVNSSLDPEVSKKGFQLMQKIAGEHTEKHAKKIGETVSDFQLNDYKGKLKSLSSFLKKGPVILNFVLGGDCPFVLSELKYYEEVLDFIELAGARLITVSPEIKQFAAKTVKSMGLQSAYLCDIGFNVMKEFGVVLESAKLPEVLFSVFSNKFPDLSAHYGYDNTKIPPYFPLRGTFVIDTDFTVKLAHVSVKDRAEPGDLIKVLRKMKGSHFDPKSSSSFISNLTQSKRHSSKNSLQSIPSQASTISDSSYKSVLSTTSTGSFGKRNDSMRTTASTGSLGSNIINKVKGCIITEDNNVNNNVIIAGLVMFNLILGWIYFLS